MNNEKCRSCGGAGYVYHSYADMMDQKPTRCECTMTALEKAGGDRKTMSNHESGTYSVAMHCHNCEHKFSKTFDKGEVCAGLHECPKCGCREAKKAVVSQ